MSDDFDIREFEVLDLPGMLSPHVTEVVQAGDRRELHNVTDPRCDFCLEPLPKWEVPCEDFVHPGTTRGSTGPWGACDGCAELIRSGDREALALRSLIPVTGASPEEVEAYREAITWAQSFFWKYKTGDPVPWSDE